MPISQHIGKAACGIILVGALTVVLAGCGQSAHPISSARAHHVAQTTNTPAKASIAASRINPFTPMKAMAITPGKATLGQSLTVPKQKAIPAPAHMTWVSVPFTLKNHGTTAVVVTSFNIGLTANKSTYASIAALDAGYGGIFPSDSLTGTGSAQIAKAPLAPHQTAHGTVVFLVPNSPPPQNLKLIFGDTSVSIP